MKEDVVIYQNDACAFTCQGCRLNGGRNVVLGAKKMIMHMNVHESNGHRVGYNTWSKLYGASRNVLEYGTLSQMLNL